MPPRITFTAMKALRRYEFGERLADLLGQSRRDVRVRITLLVASGLIPAGARGPGSPPATSGYAADLLLGIMAAPQQAATVDAVQSYRALVPTSLAADATTARVALSAPLATDAPADASIPDLPQRLRGLPLSAVLTRLLDHAAEARTADALARLVFGLWVCRGFPVAGLQYRVGLHGRSALITQRYELPDGTRPPAWLDPERDGVADAGLFHTTFLPAARLLDIGRLIVPDHERTSAVIDLQRTIGEVSSLAKLARRSRDRRPWQAFLDKAKDALETIDGGEDAGRDYLTEVTGFGANPGDLKMWTHIPEELPENAPLVVLLHGCTQTAAGYDRGTGWSTLADRHGFALLLPEQKRTNNPLRCFNWFKDSDTTRDSGEAQSITEMVDRICRDHGLDRSRVFVTGVSAGGAMTSALLAAYPDVFSGGAIIAGVPFDAAEGLQDAFEVIFQGRSRPAEEWGAAVRAASPHAGPWPRISVWHGAADSTVKPLNSEEIIKQWRSVHGLDEAPTIEDQVQGHARRSWQDAAGNTLIEAYTVNGMGHGVPIDPTAPDGCGTPAPFIIDAGISSTTHIARFWNLTDVVREVKPRVRKAPPKPERARDTMGVDPKPSPWAGDAPAWPTVEAMPIVEVMSPQPREGGDSAAASVAGVDLGTIVNRSFATAELFPDRVRTSANRESSPTPGLGLNVHEIVSTSLEAAGLLSRDSAARAKGGKAPLGIDIPGIIATSFEAAGLMRRKAAERTKADLADKAATVPPSSPSADKPEQAASPDPAPEAPPVKEDRSSQSQAEQNTGAPAGWFGEGWELTETDSTGNDAQPILHGKAVSGSGTAIERAVRTISCQLTLGPKPRLAYRRRLDLQAAANPYTRAGFAVLIDGEAIDEASAVGMDHREEDWCQSSDIDLTRFADQTVTLTFEVSAGSNVFVEVSAAAWIRDIAVTNAAD